MEPFELTSIVSVPMRPVIVSVPLAGTVELSLPIAHAGVLDLVDVAWRRGDPRETTDVVIDPEPPAQRDVLAVLDAVEDTAKARAGPRRTPTARPCGSRQPSASGPMPPTTATRGRLSASPARLWPLCWLFISSARP